MKIINDYIKCVGNHNSFINIVKKHRNSLALPAYKNTQFANFKFVTNIQDEHPKIIQSTHHISNKISTSLNISTKNIINNTVINFSKPRKNVFLRNKDNENNMLININNPLKLNPQGVVSEYQWYLQSSKLNEIYNMQRYFMSVFKNNFNDNESSIPFLSFKKKNLKGDYHYFKTYFIEKTLKYLKEMRIMNNKEMLNYTYNMKHSNNKSRFTPELQFANRKSSSNNTSINHVPPVTYAENKFDIKKNVTVKEREYGDKEKLDATVIYNSINIENIMDKVYKNIENKLRFEGLKKGLGDKYSAF